MTGALVSQAPTWARRRVQSSTVTQGFPQASHTVVIEDLVSTQRYRFRIALGDDGDAPDEATSRSLWIGLDPQEIAAAGGDLSALDPEALGEVESEIIGPVTFDMEAGGPLSVRWHTVMPLFGWIEIERLALEPVMSAAGHPVLRTPEEAAIDLCLTCHPADAMGVSHPVRVYATGADVRVPEDLPTVNDGMITCVTCHDPHGADGESLVRETIKTKLCVACHYRFRGTSKATMF